MQSKIILIPRNIVVGVGCRRGTEYLKIKSSVMTILEKAGVSAENVNCVASINKKADEKGIIELAEELQADFITYTADELMEVEGEFEPSMTVYNHVGADNVCGRSACRASCNGECLVPKTVENGVTVSVYNTGFMEDKVLNIVGFGCGSYENMTIEAVRTIEMSELVVGFKTYIDLMREYFPDKEYYENGMMQERQRCEYALNEAVTKEVSLVCSGDSGVYGMACLAYELAGAMDNSPEIKVVSGVTAANSGAAIIGAPLSHDFSVISLSDLLTKKSVIEKRLRAAAMSDMVICLYNPSSKKRADYLAWACSICLEYKDEDTVCGVVRNIGRDMESSKILTLGQLKEYNADMFTTVFIGNKSTVRMGEKMVTPRGYNNKSEKSIIIFAGTTEGRHLADYASGLNIDTHIFVATEYGEMILKDDKSFDGNKCIIHTGRLDEAEIKEEIEKINPMAVFDATHPFAVQVTENIKNACEKTTTKYIRIKRDKENYNLVNREKVRSAGSAEEAAIILSAPCYKNKKVLLTTGSKTVGIYSHLEGFKDNYYLRMLPNVQMLGEVLKSGIKNSNVICMQGPFSENMNYEMIKNYGIEVMVTKNSGNTGGTQEKINAAMRAGTEVIIIEDTGSDECIGIGLSEALKYITEIVEK